MNLFRSLALALLSFALIFGMPGCAGSAVDKDFRSRVERVDVNGKAMYSPETHDAGGRAGVSIYFRDPNAP